VKVLILILVKINLNLAGTDISEDYGEIGIKSVMEEKLKILYGNQSVDLFNGLRVIGCSKTYKIANRCCGAKDVNALKEVNLYVISDFS
jgi:hypothetical protein